MLRGQHPLLRVLDHPHILLPGLGAYHVRHDLHRLVVGRSRNILQQGLHVRNFQGQFVQLALLGGKLLLLLGKDEVLLFQIFAGAVFCFFLQFQTVPLGDLEQHLSTGGIKGDFAVVPAAEGLVRVGQFKAQCFQRLFLLRSDLAVLVFAVEHMAFMDVGCTFIQMQCPVQQVHMSTKPFMKFSNELRYHQNQIFHRCVFVQRSELVDGFFRAGFLSGKQVLYGSVALGSTKRRPSAPMQTAAFGFMPYSIGQSLKILSSSLSIVPALANSSVSA